MKKNERHVIVRCSGAGVHFGVLSRHDATMVTLRDARRIWRWRGANTLNELALRGASEEHTRISEPVADIVLCGWHEIIAATDDAITNLSRSRWGA